MSGCAVDESVASQHVIICGDNECGSGQTYLEYLESLPTVSLRYESLALSVVAAAYGVDQGEVSSVNFVPRPTTILNPAGHGVAGWEVDCNVFVSWTGAQWTSGARADGPAISDSDFAYQVGVCLAKSALAGQANAALRSVGL
jgi:hypothetical protein